MKRKNEGQKTSVVWKNEHMVMRKRAERKYWGSHVFTSVDFQRRASAGRSKRNVSCIPHYILSRNTKADWYIQSPKKLHICVSDNKERNRITYSVSQVKEHWDGIYIKSAVRATEGRRAM